MNVKDRTRDVWELTATAEKTVTFEYIQNATHEGESK